MAHDRKLVLGGVALTMARVKHKLAGPAMDRVRDDLEKEILHTEYLAHAPFKWVSLIIREGLVDEVKPHYQRISRKYGDLPLAIEIDVHRLLDASEDEMADVYREATLRALVHAGQKYDLPVERFNNLLKELKN